MNEFFNERQRNFLLSDLQPGRVRQRDGFSYLKQWDVRRHLIRLCGPGGFSVETTEAEMVDRLAGQGKSGNNHVVVWKVKVRLTVYGDKFSHRHYEAVATGVGQMSDLARAHDTAIKAAESDALKRAAINLGTQFGLSLYNNGSPVDVVKWTLDKMSEAPVATDPDDPVHPEDAEPAPDEAPEAADEPEDDHAVDQVVEDLRAVYGLDTAAAKVQRLSEIKMSLTPEMLATVVTTASGGFTIERLIDKATSDALRTPVEKS